MNGKVIAKWAVIGFLVLYLLSGLSLIIFAVTVPTPFGDYLTMKADAFPVNYGLRIGLLFLLFITTGLGFFAALKENNKLLTAMAILFVILFLVEFILGIIYFIMRSEVHLDKRKFSNGFQMLNEYGVDDKVTQAMDRIQQTYACCGLMDYRDWFTSKWAARQGKSNRVPVSCCKFPSANCGNDMDTKNPIDVINILGCQGLYYSYDLRKKVIGGVGLAIGFVNMFGLLCCIVFCFCFNAARGLSSIDALKGEEPKDKPSSDPDPRGYSSRGTPGSTRQPPRKAQYASKEKLNESSDDDDDFLPPDASHDLLDKSQAQ